MVRAQRNLPADRRRKELLDAAVELFGDRGHGITIQALADRVHVTQPLVHRYFPTRNALIEAIRDRIQNAHWDPNWHEVITDRSRPLPARLDDFYHAYLPGIYQDSWYRGFWYASLADSAFGRSYVNHVSAELLLPIIGEVRFDRSYPALEARPPYEREIELVWGMHSTMVLAGIRRHVYKSAVSSDLDSLIRDQIRGYLMLAPLVMAELMPEASATAGEQRPAAASA